MGDERGATLVEAAFVMPIFALLLFGIIELSGVMLSYSGTSNAASAGSRAAAVAGNDSMADQQILSRIAKEAAGIPNGEVQAVIIMHAYDPAGSSAATNTSLLNTCKGLISTTTPETSSNGVSDGGSSSDTVGACNVYSMPQTASTGAFALAGLPQSGGGTATSGNSDYYFGCSGSADAGKAHKLDCNWPGQDRKVIISSGSTGTSQPDFVSVYIQTRHKYYTKFIGNAVTVSDTSTLQIEPQEYTT